MQPPPPNGPPETPPAPSGTLRLRLERGAFQGPFTPLAPPLSVDLGLDGVGWDLLGRLHLQGELSLVEGHHPLPLLPDLEIHARVVAGTRAHLDLRLERTGPAGETRVAGFDLTFTSPVIIEDLVPLLLRLPGLFEDRGLQALRARGESLLAAAGLLLREHRELLELSSDLAARLRRGLERTGATAGGFPELLARLRPSTDGMVEVLLRRISARPVRRQDRWELDLRFSGETSTLDRMLVPFNDVRLPRAIVPSFHAALERLLSRSPAASARVRTDRLRTRELARALAGFADRFRASVDLAGEAPGVEVEGTTAAAGRFRVRITTPGTFSLQGEVSGRVSGTALQLRTRRLELAAGGTRTVVRGRVRVATRSKGPLVPALFERRPLDHLDLEFTGALEEGSTLPALHLSATTDHPLLLGTTGVEVALEHPTFGGDVSLRLGRSPSQAVDLRLAARFRTLPGTGFDNGQSVLEVSRLAGAVNGRIRSQAPRTFTVTLDGEARGMARTTTRVSPLPELDIEEGLVLDAGLDGELRYRTRLDTRPRSRGGTDWDFEGTHVELRLRQAQARLGDRSLTLPEETDLRVDVRAGTLATSGLGRATLDLGWDMHERSPVLRRGRRATEIWVPELRTNAFTLQVSPSGGLAIEGPPGGLYDARFFNALLNPGQELRRWLEVLDSDDAVDRIIASVRILSDSAAELLEVLRRMARRVRTVVDEEGLREPRDVIPAARIARVLTRLLDGDAALEDRILPLVRQVVAGQGLDVPRVKALLLETLPDQPFEFEVDRLLRWLSRVLAPMDPEPAFPVRDGGLPLAEDPRFTDRFRSLPPAAELYARIAGKGPLPASFSGLLARLSPWLAPGQLSWVLDRRAQELPPPVRDRLLHVLDIKRRIARIEEGYGGVSYAPQAVAISFFLGDTIAMGTLPCPAADGLDLPEDLIPHGLLGPRDVAVLLQSGLAAAWTGRTVQLNQRLLLDMLDRMPSLFLHGVLMEMGESNPRVLAGILLALLDMEQGKLRTPVDLVAFFSGRLGIPFPRRSDYMAGGRWARLSYYEALMHTAERVVDEGSTYRALKYYLQEARGPARPPLRETARLRSLCDRARRAIAEADAAGASWTSRRREGRTQRRAAAAFQAAFEACATLRDRDPRAFSLPFFKAFWARNFEALMVRSVVRNAQEDVDQVRSWLGARDGRPVEEAEQALVEQVVRVLYWHEADRRTILEDPLTRLLLDPPAGRWQLTVVSCMGVITEGARGVELAEAYGRLEALRGVRVVRADTATGRCLEYNASRVIEAIRTIEGPWAWLGYSQGCANGMMAEHLLRSGTPEEQRLLDSLRCRNLLFGAINGSPHGTAGDRKFVRAMVDLDHFLSHYQAVLSEQAIQLGLRTLRMALDARPVVLGMMGMRSLSRWGILPLSHAGQFRDDVPTSTLRGIVEPGTLPEVLEFLANILTRQTEDPGHDTQVLAEEAVGHPVWVRTPHGLALEACDTGSRVQRTHHWSPLRDMVDFVTTDRDRALGVYDTPKDRHVFPWLEVNARFGVIGPG